jgi:hypothetical protein
LFFFLFLFSWCVCFFHFLTHFPLQYIPMSVTSLSLRIYHLFYPSTLLKFTYIKCLSVFLSVCLPFCLVYINLSLASPVILSSPFNLSNISRYRFFHLSRKYNSNEYR